MPPPPTFLSTRNEQPLRVPQARVLNALMPRYPDYPPSEWPLITRAQLAARAGYTAKSGTVTRALNGIRESNHPRSRNKKERTTGDPHPGLIDKKMVEVVIVDVEGVSETNYRITHLGIKAIQRFLSSGRKIPKVKDASIFTNDRYLAD